MKLWHGRLRLDTQNTRSHCSYVDANVLPACLPAWKSYTVYRYGVNALEIEFNNRRICYKSIVIIITIIAITITITITAATIIEHWPTDVSNMVYAFLCVRMCVCVCIGAKYFPNATVTTT